MIDRFEGEYRFLSNFYARAIKVFGLVFRSNEHAYVWAKNPDAWDPEWNKLTPGQVKRKGRQVKLRKDWEEVKYILMYEINLAKFTQHEDLREKLLATGTQTLIEGNHWHDVIWGVCDGTCRTPHADKRGKNLLGKVLMAVRDQLRIAEPLDTGSKDGSLPSMSPNDYMEPYVHDR